MDPYDPIHRLLRFAVFTLETVGIRPSVKCCPNTPNCRCIQNDRYTFKFDSPKRTRSCVMVIKYASLKEFVLSVLLCSEFCSYNYKRYINTLLYIAKQVVLSINYNQSYTVLELSSKVFKYIQILSGEMINHCVKIMILSDLTVYIKYFNIQ